MCTEKIGLLFEYKFSYQFAVEYQDLPVGKQIPATSAWYFDLPDHRFVLEVSYHFKESLRECPVEPCRRLAITC